MGFLAQIFKTKRSGTCWTASDVFFGRLWRGRSPYSRNFIKYKKQQTYKRNKGTEKEIKNMVSILRITTSFGSMCRNIQNDSPLLLTKLRPFLYWRHLYCLEGLVQAMFNCERRSTEPRIYQLSHVLGVWISYPDTPVTSTMHQTGLEPSSQTVFSNECLNKTPILWFGSCTVKSIRT